MSKGGETFFKHNPFGHLEQVTLPPIITSDGGKSPVISKKYNALGKVKLETDPEGHTTETFYTSLGKPYRMIHPDGTEESLFYDLCGNLEKYISPTGSETWFTYDYQNRMISKKVVKGDILLEETYRYNAFHLLEKIDPDGVSTGYFYDGAGRKIKEVTEDRQTLFTYDPLGQETVITYNDYFKNQIGQIVTQKIIRDPKGRETKETYDAHGNVAILERFGLGGELLLRENFFYNLKGRKTKQVSELFNPDKTIIKTWKYDSRDRLIELSESGEKVTTYTYTPDGKVKTLTKPDGIVITYEYDGLGREIKRKTSDGSCHYSFKYDKMGNVIESKDEITGKTTQRIYNHFGDLLHETLGNGLSLKRTYDPQGRPKELIFSDESKVIYTYDPYHLKNVKRLDSTGIEYYEHTYDEYDKSHNLISECYPGSIGPAYHQVDLLGRRVRTDTLYSSEIIAEIDPTGNVTKYLRDHHHEQEIIEYTYDALDQLTSETGLFPHQYAYDAHYNRIQKDEELAEVDSLHQLLAQGETTHTYDPNGNRITTLKGSQKITYTYDGLDRLTHISSGSKAVRYTYDSWGRCLSRTCYFLQEREWTPTKTDHFLFDGQNEIGIYPYELRILGQGKGAEIGAAIVIEKEHDFFVPLHDLYGNVIASMYWDGSCTESYRHSAYGEEKIFNGDITLIRSNINPWRYQSKRKMGGLINFGRRFYDPQTGRWLSPDPKGFNEGPNLYQYLRNSPLLLFDLYGEAVEKISDIEEMQKQLKWDLDFEKRCGGPTSRNFTYYPDRDYSQIADHPMMRGEKQIGYIGGIKNTFAEHVENVKTLSRYAGDMPIHSTYNATHGLRNDLIESKMGLNLIGTPPAALSFQRKTNFFANASQNGIYLEIAHSQGTIFNVISQLMMPQEYRDRTVSIGIAPAMYMPKGLCKHAFHYQSMRDFVPHLQKSFGVVDNKNVHVELLKPHPEAPWLDHSFTSPTYKKPLIDHIDDYLLGTYD